MTKFDLSGKSWMNAEELAAQLALEAQLESTATLITETLTKHPHFTDDCGEYLSSMLTLSAKLMGGRENGITGLIETFKELARKPEGGEQGYDTELSWNYAEYHKDVETIVNRYQEVNE